MSHGHISSLYFEHVHLLFCAHLIIFLGLLNLDIITSRPPLECLLVYLCVNCNLNRFHSIIFNFCIMIVHTLKMCTGDAGSEQSLVLFCNSLRILSSDIFNNLVV